MKEILVMIICCFLLSGCTSPGNVQAELDVTERSPASIATQSAAQDTTANVVSFTAYRGNENADGLISREVLVPEITPDIVLCALIDDGVVPADVSVLTLTRREQQLLIDFNAAFSQYLCSMGTAGETMMINSVVNTFLSAYDAQSVMITVEEKILESGHVIYDFPLTYRMD